MVKSSLKSTVLCIPKFVSDEGRLSQKKKRVAKGCDKRDFVWDIECH